MSNRVPQQRLAVAAHPDARPRARGRVDELLFSCEIGHAKPAVEAFEEALRRLGAAPDDTLFIDDTRQHLDAAATLGLHTTSDATIEAIGRFLS